MTPDEFESLMDTVWTEFVVEAKRSKDPNLATFDFYGWYGALDPSVRAMADEVLARWVHSSDAKRQFDALAVIHQFNIRSALSSIQRLLDSLESGNSTEPQARFLRTRVLRLMADLQQVGGRETTHE